MEEITSGLDPDELMDLDEPEGSDLDEDEEDLIDDHISSPFILSSAPGSTTNSVASSPISEEFPPPFSFSGKPLNVKRGRGRPRREGGKPGLPRVVRGGGTGMTRVRKPRPPGFSRRGMGNRSVRQPDRSDFDFSPFTPSPIDEQAILDPETGALLYPEREKLLPSMEEPPYFPEHWPGKVCAFCNLGERSQLGQGEMLRLNCPEGFLPHKVAAEQILEKALQAPDKDRGDKSPKGPVTCRRQKGFNKCRHPSMNSEYVDELTIIGYNEVCDVTSLFEPNGQFYVHRNCALWSNGVTRAENSALLDVGPVVLQCSSKKCSLCNHYGASVTCNLDSCNKVFHFPCATAAGAFQEIMSISTFCSNHIGQVAMLNEATPCFTCRTMGDISNLMYCSTCGAHYHGTCVGLAQLPGVRAGWQCRKCRCCQVCRTVGDESKLMSCEQCDKVYHAGCQRPIVTSIPKYGWKCRCCRVCGDCGSRTPGAGLSSRWHAHYTVCDSCYQQRNKGFSCPLCHKAYRAHAHREMVQCSNCKKFVHGTCDAEADVATYHQKKDLNPEYEYVCLHCKNSTARQITAKRASIEDSSDVPASHESLYDDTSEFDLPSPDEFARSMGMGKGKPFASKIAKKRMTFPVGGRPKGTGKVPPGKMGFMKRSRLSDFNRKRGHKSKMCGIFGVPGVGLQRPTADGKSDEEPGVENRLVLCSAKDKYTLTQDICVMCGALGMDQEGCLISCVQCGQCYHPYCINVKITKVILEKGWRCLDCTICEGCGQRNDEARLILCDDCDVSFHIYCMDPPLDYVPHGNWKCKWCAMCLTCGATDPGFNCNWMNSSTQCGPCASHLNCPSCNEPYGDGELIIQCVQCERWLHGSCDCIKNEDDAEKCAEDGYNCILCRPRDVPPPHLVPPPPAPKPPTPTKSPEVGKSSSFYLDGVYLSEMGNSFIKSLALEHHASRKKRKKLPTVQDKEAGIMATIESVIAGGNSGGATALDDSAKLELVDVKDEPQELYKEGMIWTKEDGPAPEGFTVFTMESGISVLRRKRQRNLQKLGIGGFLVRMRGIRTGQDNDEIDSSVIQSGSATPTELLPPMPVDGDKPKRKPIRRKPKSKLAETFPAYLQEAFFGKDLLETVDCKKEVDSCSSDDEKSVKYKSINLSQDELMAVAAVSSKSEKQAIASIKDSLKDIKSSSMIKEEDDDNTEDLKDVLALPGDLLDAEIVNSIMEDDDELTKNTESLDALDTNLQDANELADTLGSSGNSKETKDELSDILGPHFNLESISNINSKDVEDIFKGVLTDESQESQESSNFALQGSNLFSNNTPQQSLAQHSMMTSAVRPKTLPNVSQVNLNSPVGFPPPSPYHSEYSNSPQFSPAFTESPNAWVGVPETPEIDSTNVGVPSTYNQRSSEKMKADESLGNGATISAVLYANMNHPEWKKDFPVWSDRYKQIIKKWRTLSQEQKAPYLQHARDNRSQLRMKKAQQSQTSKESTASTSTPNVTKPVHAVPALVTTLQAVSQQPVGVTTAPTAPITEDQEKMALQQKSAREAEQERQWKQLQAMRQQQTQQQQNIIHEQRVQAIARVQRSISVDPAQQFLSDQQSPLQPSTPQELSPSATPTPSPRQFIGMKSPTFPLPSPVPQTAIRPPTPSHSPHDVSQASTSDGNDHFIQSPSTPKPSFPNRLPTDQFIHQPATPRPQFGIQRPTLQNFGNTMRTDQQDININRQLRDLLQRQQVKKLDEMLPGKVQQQRVWPPIEQQENEASATTGTSAVVATTADTTFRQPLPPSIVRPRVALSLAGRAGPGTIRVGQLDARMQGLDPRMRLILQQQVGQQRLSAGIQHQFVRFTSTPARPTTLDQYEQLLHRPSPTQIRAPDQQNAPRMTLNQASVIQRPQLVQPTPTTPATSAADSNPSEEGIPDNVTAELEKLEQETGTMVELQGVSEILGGLGDDDDELLAEMGADFNILEYADPELEALTGGKTNILDLELEEEPVKKEKIVSSAENQPTNQSVNVISSPVKPKQEPVETPTPKPEPASLPPPPPPLALPQQQQPAPVQHTPPVAIQQPTQHPPQVQPTMHLTPQQIHQQMVHQVQQAAAQGRPMPPGSKMQTPDGFIGIVMPNNSVQLQIPQNYQQRLLLLQQLQNQKLQMRVGTTTPRVAVVAQSQLPVGLATGPRMVAAPPPPPPPPYPGPPPPYPGNAAQHQQTGLRMGPGLLPMGHFHPSTLQGFPMHPHLQRRPLLLEEQPLLLEDLLEQEKREQEKLQNQPSSQEVSSSTGNESESALLSDHDFERLKADVFNTGPVTSLPSTITNQGTTSHTNQPWQQLQNRQIPAPPAQPTMEVTTRVQMFNANLIAAPPLPPENIVTEQDKQTQMMYEQWLNHQNNVLAQQLRYYETEVQKLRKSRKSLNSKQRQLKKSGNQLTDTDAAELQRISGEQAILQKHLESSRKQSRQHGMLIQEYRNKHPAPKQRVEQIQSPLGPPSSSPLQHPSTSQSPMLSPSLSPLTQHNSPLNSPGPLISSSPGSVSVQNILQSPNSMPTNSMSPLQSSSMQASPMQQSPMQPSPRIGTPHSQSEESPGSAQSPSHVCLPPPMPRMTSPQHRRVVTSPVGMTQMRFVSNQVLQQRVRMQSPIQNFQQKPATPSPLNSPTSQTMNVSQQLQLHKLQQQQSMLQQQQSLDGNQGDPNIIHSQRTTQLLQHRNFIRQQVAQQQQIGQPQPLTPQQHQIMLQQQKQLAQQQQQQIAQMNAARLQQQNNPPHSPMPPKSPMINQQIMSPHSMPPSPMQMPPKSPMVSFSSSNQPNPNSPAARSPAFHQGLSQTPTSPMTHQPPSPMPRSPMVNQTQSPHSMRRPPSANSSPAMPDRPLSVENPSPRMSYSIDHLMQDTLHSQSSHNSMQFTDNFTTDMNVQNSIRENMQSGGGNPNNPCNPIPLPPEYPRFRYFKLGLRGGTPMWGFGRGAKRIPTPPNAPTKPEEKMANQDSMMLQKMKKEPHLSKVSILKRKVGAGSGKIGSLVSTDYNDMDDSSSTPPITPPLATTSRGGIPKTLPKKILENQSSKDSVIVMHSPEDKQLDMMDFDDDTNTVLSAEVSLSSAAQNDEDMLEMETLSQQDLAEGLSSPLEPDQIADEYLLFPGNMVVDMSAGEHFSEKEEEEETVDEEFNDENMHIMIRSPTTSDYEYIMQSKGKKYNVGVHDENDEMPESPDQEDLAVPSPEVSDLLTNYDENDVLMGDQSNSTPEESISTKEDFEELIDEGSRKNSITKSEVTTKQINEFHKYAGIFNYSKGVVQATQNQTALNKITGVANKKAPAKISLVAGPIVHNLSTGKVNPEKLIITQNPNILNTSQAAKVTSIILTHNSAVRRNVLNVPKIVSTVSPAITIVNATTSQMASILPSKFTVPVISASAVRQLSNVKVMDKPSSSSLSISTRDNVLPKKIFEDDSVSPDSSNCEDDKSKDSFDEKAKLESPSREIKPLLKSDASSSNTIISRSLEYKTHDQQKKAEHLQVMNIIQKQRVPSPLMPKSASPVIIHNTPELKMTAQVIQETQTRMKMTATTETLDAYDGSVDDTKSVVISIPSPTPSQEQMLDNIAYQALENRRREFDSIEDVLDMIENITAEPPAILEENVPVQNTKRNTTTESKEKDIDKPKPEIANIPVSVSTKSSAVPQLSPLSQPTDLTMNMANASQQLRSLLSSLQTTSTSSPTNVESVVKNFGHKISSSASPTATQPIVASRVIQQAGRQSPVVTTVNTVIVPNLKQKVTVTTASSSRNSPVKTQVVTTQHVPSSAIITSTINYIPNRTIASMQVMAEHLKFSSGSMSITTPSVSTQQAIAKTTIHNESKKPSLTLTAMLQNQPAANMITKSSADTITAASLLGSPISLPKAGLTSLVQAQPTVVVPVITTSMIALQTQPSIVSTVKSAPMKTNADTITAASLLSSSSVNIAKTGITAALLQAQPNPTLSSLSTATPLTQTSNNIITSSTHRVPTSTTNLLHTQLTKVVRSKSVDDIKEIKQEDIKSESMDTGVDDNKFSLISPSGCKMSTIQNPILNKADDSQNVLLKKLLQNTACASTQSPPPTTASTVTTICPAPKLPIRETSFVSSPNVEPPVSQPSVAAVVPTQPLQLEIKKCLPPSRSSSRDDLLSPQTPRSSTNSQDSSLQTPPIIKKEIVSIPQPQPSPIHTPQEVKKEIMDESSQHSEVSDYSRPDVPIKEETEMADIAIEKPVLDKEELKKQKRRMYQQKRRQNQILNKELAGQPKKRPRKNSKIEEDYDTYIDGVLAQLRQLPGITVSEPVLNRNHGIVSLFGSGDMSKLGTKGYSTQFGDLDGKYGYAELPGYSDFYSTKPYGDLDPIPEKPPSSTQRGFYDQEFPLIRFDTDDHKKFDMFCREDTPDSVLSSSSPECVQVDPEGRFMGLRLISDSEGEDEDNEIEREIQQARDRLSPIVPMIKPVPIRLKPVGGVLVKETPSDNKENINTDSLNIMTKIKSESKPLLPTKDSGHVTVTLTLTSSAAEDIMGVLRDLANILQIPAPTSYQIVERTTTPPSQKLGLYRTKGKDGKEGAPIDIQSILNGATKFCKHCDVIILSNLIRRKVSDLPFLAKDSELLSDGEELFFCSSTCYMQFALMHRSPSISEDKAAEIINHLSQKDNETKQKMQMMEPFDNKSIIAQRLSFTNREMKKEYEPMDTNDYYSYLHNNAENKPNRFYDGAYRPMPVSRIYKNIRYKVWSPGCLQPNQKHKIPTDKEIMELLYRMQITVTPPVMPDDTRKCMFCQGVCDGVADGTARLLNFEVDKWVHLNCGLWSDGVYETVNGALMNLENALQTSLTTPCVHCNMLGATIRCFKTRCSSVYHLNCAVKDNCVFFKNKTVYCIAHVPKNEKDNELTTLSVSRRVYVNRDENRQVAAVMHSSDTDDLLRVGSLIFLNVGQLLPHQLQNFHTSNYIYPIGYKIIRFYWSMKSLNKRCKYICSIHEQFGKPEFRVVVQEPPEDDIEFVDPTPKGAWQRILDQIAFLRKENECLQMFPKFTTGEDLFGLTEPAIVRVLESMPGIETLADYKFKYGRNPLLELPLAINPSGSCRTESRSRTQLHWKKHHTQRTTLSTARPIFGPSPSGPTPSTPTFGELSCPYSKQFVHSKSSQYKKMKQEWKNNVYLARSKIQGLGLYAARDLEKHTMVIEYIGEIIRTELAESREKQYEAKNRGIYMFRLDENRVVDATLSGGLARYINHSCNPNCVAETVEVERDVKIIIFSKRRIMRGEELAYDYKFEFEDDQNKISCMCGAPNCRKWMN
ncbi:histone-lysine N-methyltransferase 2C-like isoform X1 [Diabrotica virgifera virgifera]|uniref:Histone-lysine N-methyltransferase 2C-like n=1 Tax=Diabrotica virgifera virgifera TaxID=50390 RepID=A0ABM5KC53_DIAVI|nr:histone-lysine N-methyltransferase 2C-like isoform X1 [Diabrotica virgifera virgifera]